MTHSEGKRKNQDWEGESSNLDADPPKRRPVLGSSGLALTSPMLGH